MPRNSDRRSRTFEIAIVAMVAVALLGAGFLLFQKRHSSGLLSFGSSPPPPPLTLGNPIETVGFSDGSSLELLELAEAELLMGTLTFPSGFNGLQSSRSTGLGGGSLSLSSDTAEADGILVGKQWSSSPGNLLLACRLLDPLGHSWIPKKYLWEDQVKMESGSREGKPTWEAMVSGSPGDPDLPPLMVQISDGHGRWFDAGGPVSLRDDPWGLCILAFRVWPRSPEKLEFRAVMPGQPPVTWTLPNPRHPVTPKSWTPDTLPKTVSGPEFDLTFEGAHTIEQFPEAVGMDYHFESRVPDEGEMAPHFQSLVAECLELEGALGTRVVMSSLPLGNRYSTRGFQITPDENLLRFRFEVRPSEYYRYHRTDASHLLSGTLSEDGQSITFDSSSLKKYGLTSLTVVPDSQNRGWRWDFQFEWHSIRESDRAEKALGLENRQPVCFLDEATRSVGVAEFTGQGSSASGEHSEKEFSIHWRGIPTVTREETPDGLSTSSFQAPAKPGTKITLGLVTPLPVQKFDFVTPRPE